MHLKKNLLIFTILAGVFVFVPVQAQLCPTGSTVLCNPIGGGEKPADDLKEFAFKVIFVFAGFTTLIPIMAVVFAGFLMMVSQGNPKTVERAKTALTWTIYGFVLAIMSYALIAAMITLIGANPLQQIDPSAPPDVITNPLRDTDFTDFLKTMLTGFLGLVGLIAILVLLFNGFRYVTSGGNEEQATQAKEGIKWSVAGIITVLLAYVIVRATATLFGLR